MKPKLVMLLGMVLVLLMIVATASAQQSPPGQQSQGDMAVIGMLERDGSGFQGTALLRSGGSGQQQGQTDVVVALIPAEAGFLGIGGADEQSLGHAAIYMGTCDEPGEWVANVGDFQGLYDLDAVEQQGENGENGDEEEGRHLHVAQGSVDMGMDQVLDGQHVLVVIERQDEEGENGMTPTPGTPEAQQQEDITPLACGVLTPEASLSMMGQPMPGMPSPGQPTPGTPTVTPGA